MIPKLFYTAAPGELSEDPALVFAADGDGDGDEGPIPCTACGKGASPATIVGAAILCDRCLTADPGPAGAAATVRRDRLFLRLAAYQAGRVLARELAGIS